MTPGFILYGAVENATFSALHRTLRTNGKGLEFYLQTSRRARATPILNIEAAVPWRLLDVGTSTYPLQTLSRADRTMGTAGLTETAYHSAFLFKSTINEVNRKPELAF